MEFNRSNMGRPVSFPEASGNSPTWSFAAPSPISQSTSPCPTHVTLSLLTYSLSYISPFVLLLCLSINPHTPLLSAEFNNSETLSKRSCVSNFYISASGSWQLDHLHHAKILPARSSQSRRPLTPASARRRLLRPSPASADFLCSDQLLRAAFSCPLRLPDK